MDMFHYQPVTKNESGGIPTVILRQINDYKSLKKKTEPNPTKVYSIFTSMFVHLADPYYLLDILVTRH